GSAFSFLFICCRVVVLPDITVNAVFQKGRMKVDKYANLTPGKSKVRKQDSVMDWGNRGYGFDFDDHPATHDDVGTVATVKLCALVNNGDRLLFFELNFARSPFITQALFVDILQQAGA